MLTNKMKKGCLIALGSVAALFALGIGGFWFLASQYEKQPKDPGEAELWAAEKFVLANDGAEAQGNTPEAAKFAESYARSLRTARHLFFTEGKAGAKSFTKGRFMTYCFLTEDSIALIIHVPELRRYADDAQLTLSELAWSQATSHVVQEFPEIKRMAIGLKGSLNYSAILTGVVNAEAPLEGIQERHPVTSKKPLRPYFVATPANNGTAGGGQSATRSESNSEVGDKPEPEPGGRSR